MFVFLSILLQFDNINGILNDCKIINKKMFSVTF